VDLVDEVAALDGLELSVLHPRDPASFLDEEAFAREEYMPYWAELWPSAVVLARTVWARSLGGRRVLELGCGLALPSIAAALRGADVLATDWSPDALRFARVNARRNGASIATACCAWGEPARIVEAAPWDLVLASDVLYELRNVDLLLALLPQLVDERGDVLLADPGRPHARPFLERAADEWTIDERARTAPNVIVYRLRRR
jgi:predicted nicotinamide N-methyase